MADGSGRDFDSWSANNVRVKVDACPDHGSRGVARSLPAGQTPAAQRARWPRGVLPARWRGDG